MKKYLLISATVLSCTLTFGQKEEKEIRDANWLPGTTKTMDGVTIYRAEGENKPDQITNISWKSAEYMIEKLKAEAKEKNWAKEKTKNQLDQYENQAKGGIIELFVTRTNQADANTKNYTIIVKTKDEKELQKKTLKDQQAKPITDPDGFKNQGFFWLSEKQARPFVVYVEDNSKSPKKVYKFEIKE